jgi:hypothetical protein
MRATRPASVRPSVHSERGAVLIVALLVAALIAIVLGSYLNLNLSSTRLAKRSFNNYAALNLAEAGAEEAVWSFNRASAGDRAAWTGWSNNGTAAWQRFSGFDFGGNATGWAKVYVDMYQPTPSARPKVVSQSTVSIPGDAPVIKMVEVTLRRRSLFATGIVAKDSVAFNGSTATVDSWNSDPDNDAATAPVPYSASVRADRGSIASTSVLNTAVLINQVDVWGTVATGGLPPQVGANGSIRGANTPADVKVDPSRVATDFNADFPIVTAPVDGTAIATIRGGTLGIAGTATKWRSAGIVLNGSDVLQIEGDVTLILTGSPSVSVAGSATISIPAGAKLTIYAAGDVTIAGRGLANSNVQPISCRIWGTNTSTAGQAFDIVGRGALKAVAYAPAGDITLRGTSDIMGSVVGRSVTVMGTPSFHYDESLANLDSDEPFSISKWREITSGADYTRYMNLFQGL